ncbi:MAG: hypothetical protein F9K48_00675 [Candidatus Brocadia sp.]|nr:MAG: hypothetical protein F9K48_00675 [Candidatus Brocadia sp.]
MSKRAAVLIFFLGMFLGAAAMICFVRESLLAEPFFDIKISHIFQSEVQIFLGVLVGYFIKKFTDNIGKRRDIFLKSLEVLEVEVELFYAKAIQYMDNKDKGEEKNILINLKKLSQKIGFFEKISNASDCFRGNNIADSINSNFLELKRLISDSPFGKEGEQYSEQVKREFGEKYSDLLYKVTEGKLFLCR